MRNVFKKLFYISLALNILFIFFIVTKSYVSEENVFAKTGHYLKNKTYIMKTSHYDIYKTKQADIVMLGDSITRNVDWHELLGRQDIANRGIGGDISEGMLHRLSHIFKLKPQFVFLMAGINDIKANEATPEIIAQNIQLIVTKLEKHQIKPVLTSTLYVSSSEKKHKSINQKVDQLNTLLKQLAEEKDIRYIDLNSKLANGQSLDKKYSADGVHLLGNAYEIWGKEIKAVLEEEAVDSAQGAGVLKF